MHFKTTLLSILCLTFCISSCKKWDDHTQVTNPDLTTNLLQAINQRANLSKFYEYLQKTGVDKELSSAKSYTVWAPTNDALASLDPAIVADTALLKQFVMNHIAVETFFTRNAQTPVRVLMLDGKRVTFQNMQFDLATITEADKFYSNGVLHVIDKFAPVLPNGWELVNNTKTSFQQNNYIVSLNFNGFDPTLATIDSFSSVTGLPYYHPGSGLVARNSFNEGVVNLKDETKLYTYFILNDAAYASEVTKLLPYFATSTTDSTNNLAAYAVVKDLAVDGYYTVDKLPDTLISKSGVKIPVNKSKIVETRRLSNGIAYIMSEVNFSVKNKIPTVVVQGENPVRFLSPLGVSVNPTQNNVSAAFVRLRTNPITGQPFNDLFVYNHGIANLNVQYQVAKLPTVKYKVYWVAVNDTLYVNGTIPPVAFNQRLAMGAIGTNFLPLTPATGISVTPLNYSEVYIGDYIQTNYGTLNMFLTADNSTAAGKNSLTLDYIKLVPDIQ